MQPHSKARNLPICEATGMSDTGRVATHNEDAIAILPEHGIFLVADGIGGSVGGEIASAIAANVVPLKLESRLATLPAKAGKAVVEATVRQVLQEVNRALVDHADKQSGAPGPATTIVLAVRWKVTVLIAHLGDSRAYLWHDGRLTRLTEDHALAAQLVRWGKLTESGAKDNPGRSTLLRYLGADEILEPDFCWVTPAANDVLLLCSDGLTNMVDDARIAEVLAYASAASDHCQRLIEQANEAGGKDNISAIVVRFGQGSITRTGKGSRGELSP